MKTRRPKASIMVGGQIRAKPYEVFSRAIDDGIRCGLNRSRKHTDSPSGEVIQQHIHDAIMNEMFEYFDFGD